MAVYMIAALAFTYDADNEPLDMVIIQEIVVDDCADDAVEAYLEECFPDSDFAADGYLINTDMIFVSELLSDEMKTITSYARSSALVKALQGKVKLQLV